MLNNIVRFGLIVIIAVATFGTSPATAQEPAGAGGPDRTGNRGPCLLGRLAPDFDADQDGVVSRAEFDQGADTVFSELDQDADGTLSSDELPRFRGPRHGRGPGMGRGPMAGIARAADGDADGEVTSDEWQAFLGSLNPDADGAISEDDLRAVMPPPAARGGDRGARGYGQGARGRGHGPCSGGLSRMLDRDGDSVLEIDDLNAVFSELDQDGDGSLAADELPQFRGHRGPPSR